MVVLWDSDCGFCAWTLALVLRADPGRRVRTAPIEGPLGDRHLAHLTREQRLASIHTVATDGTVASGGEAVTALLAELPAGRPVAALTGRLPGPTRGAYHWVATHRSLLSRPIPGRAKARAHQAVARRAAPASDD